MKELPTNSFSGTEKIAFESTTLWLQSPTAPMKEGFDLICY